MRVSILGGGPAGLYCALLLKKAQPAHEIAVIERNAPNATYGWGVVFSDRTLAAFQEADYKTYRAIADHFVLWDAIDIHYRGELIRCGGHVFAGLARKQLLAILQGRCRELGVALRFETEVRALAELEPGDLLIAADGVNSFVRATYAERFQPSLMPGRAKYIWFGTDRVLDAFTFIFRENAHGLFQVHAYPFSGTTSTFIVECAEETWHRAGLDTAGEAESIAYCQELFAPELAGARLLSNNSKWISFVTVRNATWRHERTVLLGDAAHTAHFSIGSGTKLAMEDAIALANALEQNADLTTALGAYEAQRRPVVEALQQAARESQSYFEGVSRYAHLAPRQFSFNLLTRSGRISYDDLRLRDARFGDAVDRWFAAASAGDAASAGGEALFAPPPLFAPLRLRELSLANRVAAPLWLPAAEDGLPATAGVTADTGGAALLLSQPVAVAAAGRITPECAGLYRAEHAWAWAALAGRLRDSGGEAKLALLLNHAGRRGATRPRSQGLDRPLQSGAWPLVAASPLPYTPRSPTPRALDQPGMEQVRDDFVRAARLANEAGADLLLLHMAHGYLLASFLSPLSNTRDDAYGGNLENRLRFPLEVFDAVRAAWPAAKPLGVALTVTDWARGGLDVPEAVSIAATLRAHGCDLLLVEAGQSVPEADGATYGRGFLTALSDRVRNEAGIPTLVGGYLTTSNEVNTILAGGRADLCLVRPRCPERRRAVGAAHAGAERTARDGD
jgi:anthraniloyl-CoA monooxygenase